MKTEVNYTLPKLCNRDGNLSKQWYVYFYYTDYCGKKSQFRYSLGINTFKTKKERETEANAIIKALILQMQSGWNPITNKIEKDEISRDTTIIQCLDEILSIKKSYITTESYRTFNNQVSLFENWLVNQKLDRLYIINFTKEHAWKYLDYLLKERKYCGKTYNGHLSFLRNFFNSMKERRYIDESPFDGFSYVRQEVGKNNVYSEYEEQIICEYLLKNNPQFYLATRFVKYCFLRRTELGKLQIKHINWTNKTITIPSDNAKNRIQDSVTIPKSLEKLIFEYYLLSLDPNTFIFGKSGNKHTFTPSMEKLNRMDNFTDYQRIINDKLNIRKECTFYSWKHTGVVELYSLTKDPYVVMRQCRHHNIEMTMIYLRSLGCGVNEQVREW
jgi:integrase